jgi:hypothetical protein
MPLDILLPPGIVAIYNIWDGGSTYMTAGDVIFFKEENNYTRIVTAQNETYTLVPARLAVKDIPT